GLARGRRTGRELHLGGLSRWAGHAGGDWRGHGAVREPLRPAADTGHRGAALRGRPLCAAPAARARGGAGVRLGLVDAVLLALQPQPATRDRAALRLQRRRLADRDAAGGAEAPRGPLLPGGRRLRGGDGLGQPAPGIHAVVTGILPMRACHSRGPVSWTDSPLASTATVTGMSRTSNS